MGTLQQAYYVPVTDSTNNFSRQIFLNDFYEKKGPFFVLSRRQKSGKGQSGKYWLDFGPANIYLSISFSASSFAGSDPHKNRKIMPVLTLLIGSALRKSLLRFVDSDKEKLGNRLLIKWPNDLIFVKKNKDGQEKFIKMGGILCEAFYHGSALEQLIIGIGLNLQRNLQIVQNQNYQIESRKIFSEEGYFPGFIREHFFLHTENSPSKGKLLREIIFSLERLIGEFASDTHSSAALIQEAGNVLLWQEQEVEIENCYIWKKNETAHHEKIMGIIQGIDESGALLIYVPKWQGRYAVISGKVRPHV